MTVALIAGKYRLRSKIAAGSRGPIYAGVDVHSGEAVAVKFEGAQTAHPRLLYEAKMLKLLSGSQGFPTVHWYGVEGDFNVAVYELLGPSLQDLFDYSGCKFSLKTVLMLADQMITRIESIHRKGIIHRNIKPGHFLIGLGSKANIVHLIDFGLATTTCPSAALEVPGHPSTAKHRNHVGAPRYISMNAHRGLEQSRRDDLESLWYIFMYFIRGQLPWQGVHASDKGGKQRMILEKKASTFAQKLCNRAPRELGDFCQYVANLQFEETPDYALLRRSLRHVFFREGYHCGSPFDWTVHAKRVEASESKSEQLRHVEKTLKQKMRIGCVF
eukprot:TRINITY_DN37297_c0_g1_i1.p1 TRINITY_DN37297_c0_g1~~TRINITY_DN37297_c0_g1_i1.p1  ORF type:complete len:329 (-),score=43.28 TRINITY_DN37297_c0_g1_i1:437-1423(-)